MEYVHHIYMGMLQYPYSRFVIVVPEEFNEKKSFYNWPYAEHVVFDFIPTNIVSQTNKGNFLQASYKRSKLLKEYVSKYNAINVLLLTLMAYIPCLPFFMLKGINISGIIYKIYLYKWKDLFFVNKLMEIVKYKIIVSSNIINSVFILNDNSAVAKLNRLYRTKKFKFLVDPYNETNYQPKDIRSDLSIKPEQKIFLHFGGLSRRKGTLIILEAIKLIPKNRQNEFVFIFAGLIYDGIKSEFYNLVEEVKGKVRVIVFDEFCTNELLCDLCYTCDSVLIPYCGIAQSSGALGYAAWNEKPVLGPSLGLLGKLIRKNKLGESITNLSPQLIATYFLHFKKHKINTRYKDCIKLKNFINQVFDVFVIKS